MVISLEEFIRQRRIAAVLAESAPRWSGQTRAKRSGDAGTSLRHQGPIRSRPAVHDRVAMFPATGPRDPIADTHAAATLI